MTDPAGIHPSPGRIDWDNIHRNLERDRAAFEQGWNPSPEEKRRILKARAEALGNTNGEEKTDSSEFRFVEFLLDKERYAIDCRYVREIFALKDITPLPHTPAFIAGIVNVRGRIVSVVNLKILFDLPRQGLTDLNRVVVLHRDRMEFGLLVDAVIGAHQIPLSAIHPPLATFTGLRAKFSQGITKDALVILKAEQILCDELLVELAVKNA